MATFEMVPAQCSLPPAELERIISTAQLDRRTPRAPRPAAESKGLRRLSKALSVDPESILQTLCEVALDVCDADTAGISIFDRDEAGPIFRWRAIAGAFACNLGGMTRREFGPCGTTMDRGTPQLFSRPGRYFTYFNAVKPEVVEALLVPFSIRDSYAGTMWVVAHDELRRFDREDSRILTTMASFTEAGYSLLLALQKRLAELEKRTIASPMPAISLGPPLHEQLSEREREVMSMMVRGVPQKEIGFQLGISVKTVASYRARILGKLKVTGSFELLRYALDHALVNWSEVH
jgi:DNA-binding CsgD family transcriptional regulator